MIKRIKPLASELIPQWQTIYCSLMLLLVVFFIMLIAYSAIDKDRFLKTKNIEKSSQDMTVQTPDVNQAMQSLQQLTTSLGKNNEFSIERTGDGFKAIVPNPVLFGSGDASLSGTVNPMLDGIVKIAKHNDLAIQVEGHTDNIPIETEKFPSNWELSTMRAVNILRYLQKSGIPSNKLVAVGFAEYQPMANNDSQEGRQKNRRIEILFRSGT